MGDIPPGVSAFPLPQPAFPRWPCPSPSWLRHACSRSSCRLDPFGSSRVLCLLFRCVGRAPSLINLLLSPCSPSEAPRPAEPAGSPEEMVQPLLECAAWLDAYFQQPAALQELPVPALHHPVFLQGQEQPPRRFLRGRRVRPHLHHSSFHRLHHLGIFTSSKQRQRVATPRGRECMLSPRSQWPC